MFLALMPVLYFMLPSTHSIPRIASARLRPFDYFHLIRNNQQLREGLIVRSVTGSSAFAANFQAINEKLPRYTQFMRMKIIYESINIQSLQCARRRRVRLLRDDLSQLPPPLLHAHRQRLRCRECFPYFVRKLYASTRPSPSDRTHYSLRQLQN